MRTGINVPVCNFNASGYRLPTEAEWEYASRAGTTTAFYNGDITQTGSSPVDPNLDLIGWYNGNSGSTTHPVALKQPNAWYLYDTIGNVVEWCWDLYSLDLGSSPVVDPAGPVGPGNQRIFRGGSWLFDAEYSREAFRASDLDNRALLEPSTVTGIRPARTAGGGS
jgi:formylglycine-generating enzyme required for sulfatase activity